MERLENIEQICKVIVVCDPGFNELIDSYIDNMNLRKDTCLFGMA